MRTWLIIEAGRMLGYISKASNSFYGYS